MRAAMSWLSSRARQRRTRLASRLVQLQRQLAQLLAGELARASEYGDEAGRTLLRERMKSENSCR